MEAVGYLHGWAGTSWKSFERQIAEAEAWAPGKALYITEVGQNDETDTGDSRKVTAEYKADAVRTYVAKTKSDPYIRALFIYQWQGDGYGIAGTPAQTVYGETIL